MASQRLTRCCCARLDDEASHTPRTQLNVFAYRLLEHWAASMILGAVRRVWKNSRCSFCPRKETKKTSSTSTSQIDFHIHKHTQRNEQRVVNFTLDRFHKHKQRLRNFQPTLAWYHAQQRVQRCSIVTTCVWEFVGVVRWAVNVLILRADERWKGNASDQTEDRRTENCYKNFVRFAVHMLCVECDALDVSVTLKWPWIFGG